MIKIRCYIGLLACNYLGMFIEYSKYILWNLLRNMPYLYGHLDNTTNYRYDMTKAKIVCIIRNKHSILRIIHTQVITPRAFVLFLIGLCIYVYIYIYIYIPVFGSPLQFIPDQPEFVNWKKTEIHQNDKKNITCMYVFIHEFMHK
jgi:hypothetical protein